MNQRRIVTFTAKGHRVALGIFATCLPTAVILPLLFPDHSVATMVALALLGIGACAVLVLLTHGLWTCLSSREDLRHRIQNGPG